MTDGDHSLAIQELRKHFATDSRFKFMNQPQRVGFYNNFGRALALIPENADYVAFCDQDDIWHTDNIAKKIELAISQEADLVYGDARLMKASGAIYKKSLFRYRRNPKKTNFEQLLLLNSIHGMSMVFSQRTLKESTPFPKQGLRPVYFHDMWVGLNAARIGKFAFLNESTIDYRQHETNTTGVGQRRNALIYYGKIIRCLIDYPFNFNYSMKLYRRRNKFYRSWQIHEARKKPSCTRKKPLHYRCSLSQLLGYLSKGYMNHFITAWVILIAEAQLACRWTRPKALKAYRQAQY